MMGPLRKCVITADDYGMSPAVNRAIEQGILLGTITSTNVMTNMPCCADIAGVDRKGASVGIHWTLTCGKPVLPPSKVPSLVDEHGGFHSFAEFRRLFRKKRICKAEVICELKAQYQRFLPLAGQPDYWNTHENVNVEPELFSLFVQTANTLGIMKMRGYQRIYVPASAGRGNQSLKWKLLEPLKAGLLNKWHDEAKRQGMTFPQGRICCMQVSDYHRPEYLFSHIDWKQKVSAEISIHPATQIDSPYFGNLTDDRLIEYRIYTDKSLLDTLRNNQIELCSFEKL